MQSVEPTPVYFHTCRVLGLQTRIPRALIASRGGEYVLLYQHKCPFCNQTAGEPELAPGVTMNTDGSFSVNTAIATKMQ